jgi:uncharacterized protein YdhG (YjbR/CyaY superfamily)
MIKLCLLLLSLSLFARENPFFPINSDLDIPLTLEQNQKAPMLKRAAISLPSTAREIESVIIKYKNLDGSIQEKSIELKNSVDWHLPIFISQNYELGHTSQTQKKISKAHKKTKVKKFKKFTSLAFISFYTRDKVMKIETNDKLLRSFLLVKPHRIVCDFKRDTDLRSFVKKADGRSLFKKISIGTHKGYYRVVIELDGFYRYRVKHTKSGYQIILR